MPMELEDEMAPEMEYPKIFVERTLAIIKPDAVAKTEEIQDIILRSGFAILEVSWMNYDLLITEYTMSRFGV